MENHFKGVSEQERYNNDVLSELRQIRQLLERNAQTSEGTKETVPRKPRGRGAKPK